MTFCTEYTVLDFQVDKFSIEAIDLGQVFKIRVRHDNSLVGAAWYLEQVEVLDVDMEEVYMFLCERWLSTQKEDKCIDRTFFVKVSYTFNSSEREAVFVSSSFLFPMSDLRDTKVKESPIQIQRGSLRPNWDWTEMPTRRKRRKKWQRWRTVQVRSHNCYT